MIKITFTDTLKTMASNLSDVLRVNDWNLSDTFDIDYDELDGVKRIIIKLDKRYKGEQMNNREDILAEINMIKVLVWKLWEETHGSIEKNEWDDLKKSVIEEMRK